MRRALLFLLLLAGCSTPAAPPQHRWEKGPGCTLYTMHKLNDVISEIVVQHFEHCVRVEWDSVLVQ